MKQALIILGALVLVSGGGFFLLTGPGIMGMNGAIDDAKIAPGGNPVNANVAGDPAVGKVEAVAAAQAYLSEWTDNPHEVIAEVRLMGMGEYDAISGSADGIPESWTNRDVDIQSDPVWVVVLGVAGNLSHAEFIQASAEMRQYFLGKAGESFMWPDGTSRAVMVFDATTGDMLTKSLIAPGESYIYDRIVAYPTSLP